MVSVGERRKRWLPRSEADQLLEIQTHAHSLSLVCVDYHICRKERRLQTTRDNNIKQNCSDYRRMGKYQPILQRVSLGADSIDSAE